MFNTPWDFGVALQNSLPEYHRPEGLSLLLQLIFSLGFRKANSKIPGQ